MVFLMLPGKIVLLFPKNRVFLFGHKMEDDLSQKLHRNIILSVCLVKMRIFFFSKYDITISSNAKIIFCS